MLRKAILFCIGLCCPILLFGQGHTSNWYFGEGAGLRFNADGSVTVQNDGKLATYEGCATISDGFGNLLFYTDGIVIYNREHELMENGSDLYGDPSSTQSAIIVPKPEDQDIYYIFSVDTASTSSGIDRGIHYSIVDLRLNNGLGAVTSKNIRLLGQGSEKIAAVIRDCFDRSIWVVTMAADEKDSPYFNTLYAWEVTASGVNRIPIKTTFPDLYIDDPRGYLKFSPDGSLLASANQTSGLYLFDFDLITGHATGINRIDITAPNHNPYGVEFSPGGQFLYVHTANEALPPRTDHFSRLLQFDLDSSDIAASVVQLDDRAIFRGALQLGNNGKIYRTISKNYYEGSNALGVIHNPDAPGSSANYEHNAVDLGIKQTHQGLPPFVQSFFGSNNLIQNEDGTTTDYKMVCEGESIILQTESIPGAVYIWQKDGDFEASVTGNQFIIPNALPDDAGNYSVEIIPADPTQCPILGISVIDVLPTPSAQLTLTQCDYDIGNSADGLTRINLEAINPDPDLSFDFFESVADRDSNNPIPDPSAYNNTQAFAQTLYYRATNILGCSADGQIVITIVPGDIQPSAFGPVSSCDEIADDARLSSIFDLDYIAASYAPLNVAFYASVEDLASNRNPLSGQYETQATTLYVRKDDGGQCLGAERLDLVINPSPELVMPESFALCSESGELVLTGPPGFNNFAWYSVVDDETEVIATEPSVTISAIGDYSLEARIEYEVNGSATSCMKMANFSVVESGTAIITDIAIKDFSTNNTVTVAVEGIGQYEYALDGNNYQDSPYFENVEPGIQSVYVRDRNGCGTVVQEITVLGYPKFFTPNGDGVNDYWQLTGVDDEFESDAMIMIYDRYGSIIAQISPSGEGWNGESDSHRFPASDYWFRVILRSGREFTGHFALKR